MNVFCLDPCEKFTTATALLRSVWLKASIRLYWPNKPCTNRIKPWVYSLTIYSTTCTSNDIIKLLFVASQLNKYRSIWCEDIIKNLPGRSYVQLAKFLVKTKLVLCLIFVQFQIFMLHSMFNVWLTYWSFL